MLLLALVLLGTALALAVLCPRVLTAGRWHLFHPRAALTVWFGSFGVSHSSSTWMAWSGLTNTVVVAGTHEGVPELSLTFRRNV